MARGKPTKRKTLAKKKSGADKRRSPRIAAQNELEDYDDEPAPEAEDVDYRQTAVTTRRDNAREKRDDAEQTAADDADRRSTKYWKRVLAKRDHSGGALEVYLGRRRRSSSRKGAEALPCDPFKSQGYGRNYEEGDDHPPCVEQTYRKAGFDWDHALSRAMIDKLAVVCKAIDLSVPVPNNHYMLAQWVEWICWQASKATPARRVALRAAAKAVANLATDSYEAMSAIAEEQGSPGFCESCAMTGAGLLDEHQEIDEITFGGLVMTRDGRGGLCGNQINYFTAPSC